MTNIKIIVYAGGFWATNIGNAFFDLGCRYLLKKACPDAKHIFTTEQPGNFWAINNGNPKNSLEYIGNIQADYIVIAGPMISKDFPLLWKDTLKRMKKNNTKLILLSAGCLSYGKEEMSIAEKMLEEFPPHAIITRDRETYDYYKKYTCLCYDGIDCAFFIPEYFYKYELKMNKYVILNYDYMPEPEFSDYRKYDISFSFDNKRWSYRISKMNRFLEVINARKYKKMIGDYEIVRTRHQAHPTSIYKLYKAPNSYTSDLPYDYLNLYANSAGVFSDRVHACAAAIALGTPAMLFNETPRAAIFERIGLENIKKAPVTVSKEYINEEKNKMIGFMRTIFKK